MIRLAATIAFFAALPAGVAATATLHASERQDPRAAFHQAHFEVQNSTGSVVAAVAFRRDGGPTVLVDALIPPGTSGSGEVPLPALSPEQTVDVSLLASANPADIRGPLATLQSQLSWPKELVAPDRLVNGAYSRAIFEPPPWPESTKRYAFLVLVVGAILSAGVCLVSRAEEREQK